MKVISVVKSAKFKNTIIGFIAILLQVLLIFVSKDIKQINIPRIWTCLCALVIGFIYLSGSFLYRRFWNQYKFYEKWQWFNLWLILYNLIIITNLTFFHSNMNTELKSTLLSMMLFGANIFIYAYSRKKEYSVTKELWTSIPPFVLIFLMVKFGNSVMWVILGIIVIAYFLSLFFIFKSDTRSLKKSKKKAEFANIKWYYTIAFNFVSMLMPLNFGSDIKSYTAFASLYFLLIVFAFYARVQLILMNYTLRQGILMLPVIVFLSYAVISLNPNVLSILTGSVIVVAHKFLFETFSEYKETFSKNIPKIKIFSLWLILIIYVYTKNNYLVIGQGKNRVSFLYLVRSGSANSGNGTAQLYYLLFLVIILSLFQIILSGKTFDNKLVGKYIRQLKKKDKEIEDFQKEYHKLENRIYEEESQLEQLRLQLDKQNISVLETEHCCQQILARADLLNIEYQKLEYLSKKAFRIV